MARVKGGDGQRRWICSYTKPKVLFEEELSSGDMITSPGFGQTGSQIEGHLADQVKKQKPHPGNCHEPVVSAWFELTERQIREALEQMGRLGEGHRAGNRAWEGRRWSLENEEAGPAPATVS